jgi:2',3'-cyclic-nucleotide 2'-phosphodiesterase (5'-nucleotidase family)
MRVDALIKMKQSQSSHKKIKLGGIRMKLIRSVFIIVVFFITIFVFPEGNTGSKLPENYTLTILHTNDFHGADYRNLAKIATVIKKIRSEEKNVLYLDAGDTFSRGEYHLEFYGELEFAVLNSHAMR